MTKEEKLELVSKAIDKGFKVELSLYDVRTKEEAEDIVKELAAAFTQPYKYDQYEQHRWFNVEEQNDETELDEKIELTVFLAE